MPVFYKIDKEQALVVTSGSGEVTFEEMMEHQNRLGHDPNFAPNFSQVIDTTQPTSIEFTPDVIRRLARRNLFSPCSRRAIIAEKDLIYAHARMFEILREFEGEVGIRVFRTREETFEWIGPSSCPLDTLN